MTNQFHADYVGGKILEAFNAITDPPLKGLPDNAAQIVAIAMNEAMGEKANKKRKAVMLRVIGYDSLKLIHESKPHIFAGLWHWLKMWKSEEDGHWHVGDRESTSLRLVWEEIKDVQ